MVRLQEGAQINDIISLYRRYGFEIKRENGEFIYMQLCSGKYKTYEIREQVTK